ncbi:hypothetical protein DSC45_34440 [Streptomyces sp. YIM 130001]|nr:hypothetical protein DSC45_34440 [Streptomyces sp. YIM 130001]
MKIDPSGDYHDGRQAIGELFGELFQMEFTSDFQDVKRTVVGWRTAMQVVNSTLTFPELGDYQERFTSVLTFTRDAGEWRVLVNAGSPQS